MSCGLPSIFLSQMPLLMVSTHLKVMATEGLAFDRCPIVLRHSGISGTRLARLLAYVIGLPLTTFPPKELGKFMIYCHWLTSPIRLNSW